MCYWMDAPIIIVITLPVLYKTEDVRKFNLKVNNMQSFCCLDVNFACGEVY